jgi:predicted component of type VI protein secretion system
MEHPEQPTKRAPQGSGWSIDDAVVRLRLWATESAHALPELRELKLGSGAGCDVRLQDRTGQLSREHAMLVPEGGGWQIRDLGSRNGLWVEGSRTGAGPLRAGARIQLGGLILVAESLGFISSARSRAGSSDGRRTGRGRSTRRSRTSATGRHGARRSSWSVTATSRRWPAGSTGRRSAPTCLSCCTTAETPK